MTIVQARSNAIIALLSISTSACSPEPAKKAIQANEENCKPENITAIKDKTAQQEFARACAHRGEFKPSEKKSW